MILLNTSKKYKISYNRRTKAFRIYLKNDQRYSNIRIGEKFISPSNASKLELKKISSNYIITELEDSLLEMIFNILHLTLQDNLTHKLIYEIIKSKFYEQEISL